MGNFAGKRSAQIEPFISRDMLTILFCQTACKNISILLNIVIETPCLLSESFNLRESSCKWLPVLSLRYPHPRSTFESEASASFRFSFVRSFVRLFVLICVRWGSFSSPSPHFILLDSIHFGCLRVLPQMGEENVATDSSSPQPGRQEAPKNRCTNLQSVSKSVLGLADQS